jgi:hypothetical protein
VQVDAVEVPPLESLLTQPGEGTVAGLWRKAETLAGGGEFREGVRTLYLAVLALLHRANLIRYERTRTNGEYAQQLRAHEGLHEPFVRLTHLFELKWYSDGFCEAGDYRTCREWAENLRDAVADGD